MKFWIDECLSPALVGHAHGLGYDATCTRDRGQLGARDSDLLAIAVGEEFVFVTNNEADFMGLCANTDLHAGLIVMAQGTRNAQIKLFSSVIEHIEQSAAQAGETPADWMLNRAVEISEAGACEDSTLFDH